ncbi:MAG: hypothetical protein ABUT20_32695, partial [Bacteroidota bacterium]
MKLLFLKFSCIIALVLINQKIRAQAVVSNPMAIGLDCGASTGKGFKVFSYVSSPVKTLAQIGLNCTPSLSSPGFSPTGGSIAFSPADQKIYFIGTTTGNNSIIWSWTPGTCPTASQAAVYTYTNAFIVGLDFNPVTGDGYQVEFSTGSAPYDIYLRKITSFSPLTAGSPQQIFLPAGVKIYSQNGDVVMTSTGQMYFAFDNKLFTLDYSPYGTGTLNASYIDTIKGLGTNVKIVGLSYANGKLIASASKNGSSCSYKEIDVSTTPVSLASVIAPIGTLVTNTFTSMDMASLITGVGAAKKVFSVAKTGTNTYQVKYDIKVKNYGNVNLTSVQVTDDIKSVFGTSVFVSASAAAVGTLPLGLSINSSYNGNSDINIFAAGGTMKATPQDSATVRITVNLNNPSLSTVYKNSAKASATGSFFSINVSDLSKDDAGLDPDPNSNDVPDDTNEDTPTPLVLSTWVVVLPLKVIDFNAEADQGANNLYWKIINDEHELQMNIQRSNDGKTFSSIKTMQCASAQDVQKYEWTDTSPLTGDNYYR